MKVKMLRTQFGVNDGETYPARHEAGKVYSLGENLAEVYIDQLGAAEKVCEKKSCNDELCKVNKVVNLAIEKKVIEPKTENKAKKVKPKTEKKKK